MSSPSTQDTVRRSSSMKSDSATPKFTSFKPPVPSDSGNPSHRHRNTGDRATGGQDIAARVSRRRDGRSASPQRPDSRRYRRRSRDRSRDRHASRSHRQRDREKADKKSVESTQSRERRPRSERRPPYQPYSRDENEPSPTLESLSIEESPDGGREPANPQPSASQQGQGEHPNKNVTPQTTLPNPGQDHNDGQALRTSDKPYDFERPNFLNTPSMTLGTDMTSTQQSHPKDSRFQYSAESVPLSSDFNPADLPNDDLFVFDRKGDPDILKYGKSNNMPNYRVGGRGYILGLGREYRIDRGQSDHSGLVLRRLEGDSCIRDPEKHLAATPDSQVPHYEQRIKPEPRVAPQSRVPSRISFGLPENRDSNQPLTGSSSFGPNEDFIPLDTDDWGEPPPYQSTPTPLPLFNSLEELLIMNGCPTEPPKNKNLETERRARNATLTSEAFDNPTDVSAWLRLIDYQDILVRGSESESLPLTKNEQRSLAEIKLSWYAKALRKVGKNAIHRDRLLLGRLQLGAQLWERERLLEQWKTTLADNPDYIALWVKYLDFFQTDSPTFHYLECVLVHMQALKAVSDHRRRDVRFSSLQAYVFLRLTILHREAGYHEFATGLWQALLEYCLFKPERVDDVHDPDGALAEFKTFWNSEVARIGEVKAKGWNSGTSSEVTPSIVNYSTQWSNVPLIASWTKAERERMNHSVWRSLDSTNPPVNASRKICLFSDARQVLQLFTGWESEDSLINAFLCFNHLPPMTLPQNLQTARSWSWDSFLRTDFAENVDLGLDWWRDEKEEPPKAGEALRRSHPFKYPMHSFLQTTDTLLANRDSWVWFASLPWWHGLKRPDSNSLIRRTLQSLANRNSRNDELMEYYLAFEFHFDFKAGRLAAKKIMKERKQSLRGWNCLATMEWLSGDRARADSMWSSMISISADWEPKHTLDRGILWQSWIWKYLDRDLRPAASHILFSIANGTIDPLTIPVPGQSRGEDVAPAVIARTQATLRDFQAQCLAFKNARAYVAYTDCLSLVYSLGGWPVRTSLDNYGSALTALEQSIDDDEVWKEYTAELLHQARARLIYNILTAPVCAWKPIEFRPFFKESLTRFPHNTMIATLWLFTESRILRMERICSVDDLIGRNPDNKTHLSDITIPTNPISSILLSIWAEISSPRGGNRWTVRPLFEKALEESNGARSNLTIWKLYILYELDQVKDLTAAKGVFYRAINACPWSKELAMIGFEQLRTGMSLRASLIPSHEEKGLKKEKGLMDEEVERLFLVLCERGLFIRVPIKQQVRNSLINRLNSGAPTPEPMEE